MRTSVAILGYIVIGLSMVGGDFTVADETKWQIITPFPDNTKPQNALIKTARKIRRLSDGSINLRFVGASLSTNTSVMQRFESDPTFSAAMLSNFEYAHVVPDANLYSQPFLFDDEKELLAIRSKLDAALIAQLQHDDYVVIGISGIGFAHLMTDEPIRNIDELAGKTVWLPGAASLAAPSLADLSLTIETEDPLWQEPQSSTASPTLMVHAPIALILDKKIPRFNYLLQPPIHYGYLLLIVKRPDWDSLNRAERNLLQEQFLLHLRTLEKNAGKAAARAIRVLTKRGMHSIRFPLEDIEKLRRDSTRIGITPALQSQLLNALQEYRGAAMAQ